MLRRPITRACQLLALGLGLCVVALPCRAWAHGAELPDSDVHALAIGPSFAWAPGDGARSGALAGLDATVTAGVFWASLGSRVRIGEPVNAYPYVEMGGWFLLNFGLGYSIGVGPQAPRYNWHLFVGLPYPLPLTDRGLPFIEPYYRPTIAIASDAPVLHEFGLLVKWGWNLNPKR